jgi:hypothetical protein
MLPVFMRVLVPVLAPVPVVVMSVPVPSPVVVMSVPVPVSVIVLVEVSVVPITTDPELAPPFPGAPAVPRPP